MFFDSSRQTRRPGWLAAVGLAVVALVACGRGGVAQSVEPAVPASSSAPGAESAPAPSAAAASGQASPSASASADARQNGQLGVILEINNVGWQTVLKAPQQRGMVVAMVIPNQPGAKAGLVEGDVIMKMNGVDLLNANVANLQITKLKVGDKVNLDVARKNSNNKDKVDLVVDPAQQLDLLNMLTDLVNQDTNNPRGYFLRAAYGDKDLASAQRDYEKTIQLEPKFASAYVQLGTLLQTSDPAKALQNLGKAIQIDASYEPAYVNRGVLESSQKAYDKAKADDLKAVELDPTDPSAMTNLGLAYLNTGDPAKAMESENKALQIDPTFGPALLYRGLMLQDQSRVDLLKATQTLRDEKLRILAQQALVRVTTS